VTLDTRSARRTLGISATATLAEARQAWKARARACHPDRVGGSEAMMSALNEAYQLLKIEMSTNSGNPEVNPRPSATRNKTKDRSQQQQSDNAAAEQRARAQKAREQQIRRAQKQAAAQKARAQALREAARAANRMRAALTAKREAEAIAKKNRARMAQRAAEAAREKAQTQPRKLYPEMGWMRQVHGSGKLDIRI
jgi:curved DNA-binding protein CbpA